MTETGKFSLIFRCHASLVTSETRILPRGNLICTRDNSTITFFSASVFFEREKPQWQKKVKGNHTQNPNRLQKEFFIPCEVFRNEKERRESGFPEENCRYVSFPSGKRALVGFIKTRIRPNDVLIKDLWNSINRQLNECHRNSRCQIPDKHGILIRCPDSNKCSDCPFSVKAEDRQLTIVNYSEPEELAIGISELDGIENEMNLEVISKGINRRDPKAGRVFDLLAFHGYQLYNIAMMEGLTDRQIRYLLDKIKKFGGSLMAR